MTKTAKLLAHLQNGGNVTGATAFKRFQIYRLSSVIHKHRKRLGIVCEMVTRGGVTFGKYYVSSKPK